MNQLRTATSCAREIRNRGRFHISRAARRCLDAVAVDGFSFDKLSICLGPDVAVGAVRASLGIPSNIRDVDRAVEVVGSFD